MSGRKTTTGEAVGKEQRTSLQRYCELETHHADVVRLVDATLALLSDGLELMGRPRGVDTTRLELAETVLERARREMEGTMKLVSSL